MEMRGLVGGDSQLVVEGVMPHLLHVVPAGHDAVLDGVLQREDTCGTQWNIYRFVETLYKIFNGSAVCEITRGLCDVITALSSLSINEFWK